jgi:hypothetical protein
MSKRLGRAVDAVLFAAIAVDAGLTLSAALAPRLWFEALHTDGGPDALHLAFLYRCAAHWTAFALLQVWTLIRWRSAPQWLAVTAGARLTDTLTDATYWMSAPGLSEHAWTLLPPPFLNAGMGIFLLAAYRRQAPRLA